MPEALAAAPRAALAAPRARARPGRRRHHARQRPRGLRGRGARLIVAGTAVFGFEDIDRAYHRLVRALAPMTDEERLERALELAERGRGTTAPEPASSARCRPRRRGRGRGLARAGRAARTPRSSRSRRQASARAARRSTSPSSRAPTTGGRRRAWTRSSRPGVARVVAAVGDPNPQTNGARPRAAARGGGRGRARRRRARVARAAPERGLPRWVARRAAVRRLQGGHDARRARRPCPGSRWVTGEESRRLVHELRARVGRRRGRDGHGARRRPAADRARRRRRRASRGGSRSAAGRSRTDRSSSSVGGPLEEELARLAAEGVQSLLLEGGPTLATAFLARRPRRQARCSSSRRSCRRGPGLAAPAARLARSCRATATLLTPMSSVLRRRHAAPAARAAPRSTTCLCSTAPCVLARSASSSRAHRSGRYAGRCSRGIVRELGTVEAVEGGGGAVRLRVRAPETAAAHRRRRLGERRTASA